MTIQKITPFKSSKTGSEITLPIMAELIRRDDGSFLLYPRAMDSAIDSWISAKQAATMIGIGGRSIYRLIDPECPFLVNKRPLKGRCLISLKSVQNFIQATSDPDFWQDSLQQKMLSDSVRKKMEALRGAN